MLNLRAAVMRFCDLSWESLVELKQWIQRNPITFDVERFNNNPGLRIASATNEAGQTVCYCTLEKAFVIGSLAHNPQATEIEMRSAGAHIEAAIAHEAAQSGATSLLLVVPENMPSIPDERFIRVVERRIVPIVSTHTFGNSASHAKFCS